MKVLIFCATKEDQELYMQYNKGRHELVFDSDDLNENTVHRTKGFAAIVILTRCIIHETMARELENNGVLYILTRSAGFDHMDIIAIKNHHMKAANVSRYSPNAIAEYVCMTSLMAIRRMKRQMEMIQAEDFTLCQIRGRELRKLTIGIIGTGRIGYETLKIFSAFTDQVLVYDVIEREDVKEYGTYVSLDTLYQKSDLIVYHCPLTKDNARMLNDETLSKMKDGVILINPARGGLWDYQTVLKGIESKKIEAVVFDVYENEKDYLRKTKEQLTSRDEVFTQLLKHENVIYTAHSAFYTDIAIQNMIEYTVENLTEFEQKDRCQNEL